MKANAKDASLHTKTEAQVKRVIREIERYTSEALATTWVSGAVSTIPTEQDRQQWALNLLCDVLLRVGNLVPLSKRYEGDLGWLGC